MADKTAKWLKEIQAAANRNNSTSDPDIRNKLTAAGFDPDAKGSEDVYRRLQYAAGIQAEIGIAEAALDKAIRDRLSSGVGGLRGAKLDKAVADVKAGKTVRHNAGFGLGDVNLKQFGQQTGYLDTARKELGRANDLVAQDRKTYAATGGKPVVQTPKVAAPPPPEQEQFYLHQQGPVGGEISGGQNITGGTNPFAQFIQANRERAGRGIDVSQVQNGRLFDPKGLSAGEAAADRNILGVQGLSAKKGLLSKLGGFRATALTNTAGQGISASTQVHSNQSLKPLFSNIQSPYGRSAPAQNPGESDDDYDFRKSQKSNFTHFTEVT